MVVVVWSFGCLSVCVWFVVCLLFVSIVCELSACCVFVG